jgi:hypothetical protein
MNKETDDIVKKVLKGTRIAVKRLIKARALTDDKLIISQNGKVVAVKAKDLLNR